MNVMFGSTANIHSEGEPLDRDNTSTNSDGDGQQAVEVSRGVDPC